MRRRPTEPRSVSADAITLPAIGRVCAELLQADEQANGLGQPFLTEAGVCYLRQMLLSTGARCEVRSRDMAGAKPPQENCPLPSWDFEGRRLWLGAQMLKEFRQPAPNQTTLLDVFQEAGWARAHIDDPLPRSEGECEEDAKRRLHDTIKNLNRGLPRGTIRFRGDGTGQGIVWEYDRCRSRGGEG